MKRYAPGTLLCATLAVASSSGAQEGVASEPWSSASARSVPRGRWEFGLFQNAHYGATRNVELALQPAMLFVMPHLEVKVAAPISPKLTLAAHGRWSFPTSFLAFVSREGSGGLLPKTSRPPFAVQIEGDFVASYQVARWHEISARVGLAVAPHDRFTANELPLLDFPFLYPRFAAVYTPVVPRMAVDAEGAVVARCFYHLGVTGFYMPELPDVGDAWAIEALLAAEYRPSEHFAVSLGARLSDAKYAIGVRRHTLPFVDVRVGF